MKLMKFQGKLSGQHRVKAGVTTYMTHLMFLSVPFFVLFCLIGCSDVPYTGPALTVDNVDRYLSTTGQDTVCLQDGFDSLCIKVIPGRVTAEGTSITPNIRIFENRIVYVFNYEHDPILESEQVINVTQGDNGNGNNGNNGNGNNGNGNNGNGNNGNGNNGNGNNGGGTTDIIQALPGWVVSIYYPDGVRPENALPSLQGSGFNIIVLNQDDVDITANVSNFALTTTAHGDAFQFFVPTDGDYITIQVKGLIPNHLATFIVDTRESGVSLEETEAFLITPLN